MFAKWTNIPRPLPFPFIFIMANFIFPVMVESGQDASRAPLERLPMSGRPFTVNPPCNHAVVYSQPAIDYTGSLFLYSFPAFCFFFSSEEAALPLFVNIF